MTALSLTALVAHPAAAPGGQGFYDPRSWFAAIVLLAVAVGAGWWLRRPSRRGTRKLVRPVQPTGRTSRTEPRHHREAGRPRGPDDDEAFLRQLTRHHPPA